MSGNAARPAAGTLLCALNDLADPGTKGFAFREGEALFHGFVLRQGDAVKGFVDSCPHAGWKLSGIGDNYLTRDERYILCSGHGALFRPDDGECVAGPCFGDRLEPWPVRIEDGLVMTDEPQTRAAPPYWGGCHCGAVRLVASAAPLNVRACHCRSCRKVTGAPFYVRAVFPRTAVEITGEISRYASSSRLERGRCARCGTFLFPIPVDRPDFIGVSVACLDDPAALPPEMHIYASEKLDWVRLDDGLPQHPQGVPW